MNTIYLDNDENIELSFADNIRAFGGEYLEFITYGADRIEVTGEGVTLVGYCHNDFLYLSVLPILRQAFVNNADRNITSMTMFKSITFNVAVYNANGEILNDLVKSFTNLCLYVAVGEENYAGVRYTTYNPNTPTSGKYLTFFSGASSTHFTTTAGAPIAVTMGAGLRHVEMFKFFNRNENAVIESSEVLKIDGDDTTTFQRLKVFVIIDNRKENIIFLRWIDNAGIRYGRAFSIASKTTAGRTSTSYTQNRIMNGEPNAPIVDKKHTETLVFGDDAIKDIYLHEIETLVTSPRVEYYNGKKWEHVTLQDTSLTQNIKEHLFNFSATLTRADKNVIEW